jgi:hypothetical protein
MLADQCPLASLASVQAFHDERCPLLAIVLTSPGGHPRRQAGSGFQSARR